MSNNVRSLLNVLLQEKKAQRKGGIYNKLQVDFAYNSNHIEGSKLTHEQTRYIYETKSVDGKPALVNDIIEAVNHFRCFDYILDTMPEEITSGYIKELHRKLKSGTISVDSDDAVIGEYKKYPNIVADIETTEPKRVAYEVDRLLKHHAELSKVTLYDIIEFHAEFEKIHPFYDGNGRIGRLLMLKQCLSNDIVPFFIDDLDKVLYYRGLREWQTGGSKGYLIDTCLLMQDQMKKILDYFQIEYDRTELKLSDVLAQHSD